ncbi:ATP-dependent DNA helicase PcrA [Corynebacterium ciconiae DSM 44920]|uniref:3'-5' exonuclease n=1 Tax=Corynebacterium ciconiae TaxID=227319 RepID=UPI00036F5493|nr:3'-5' exonuclease [Corynebacterium ciconiae]WKD60140.1 ATP-dependent DNA helicase PcrA [Corynebacterium ciconiae DSM 44920]
MSSTLLVGKNFRSIPGLEKQILNFIEKLKKDPSHPSLRIKPLNNTADPRVRTGRVTDQYRAVLVELEGSDGRLFMLLHVDNHDEAIAYAQTVTVKINSTNGEVVIDNSGGPATSRPQDLDAEIESRAKQRAAEIAAQQLAAAHEQQPEPPVGTAAQLPQIPPRESLRQAGISTEELITELGLSADTVADIEAADTEAVLDELLEDRPEFERDAILGLLAGMSIDEVIEDLGLQRLEPGSDDADSDDAIIDSLQRSSYWIDPSEHDLKDILERGSFAEWRTFLHPSQQRAVQGKHRGSARIVGGAGTGKTVVLLHRTRFLYEQAATEGTVPRIFLTTFTKELARQLKAQMNVLDPAFPEASMPGTPGVWINAIDSAISNFITNARKDELDTALQATLGISTSFVPRPMDARDVHKNWELAAELNGEGLPAAKRHPDFLNDEFTDIILAHSITELKDYLRISRTGRRTALGRKERKIVWAIVQAFIRRCSEYKRLTYPALAVVAAHILESRQQPFFDHVVVDEGQDFHAGHWRFIRACVAAGPNDIFLAEDSHQRIYGNQLPLSRFGIDTRGGATRRLRLNYRTTAQNLNYASAILDGVQWLDSSGEDDTLTGYRSVRTGPLPRIVHAATPEEEDAAIERAITAWTKQNSPSTHIGVLCRDNQRVLMRNSHLKTAGITTSTLRSGAATLEAPVSVMTMHNAKGMEFTHVILDGITEQTIPRRGGRQPLPDADREDSLQRERALLYVAASRARDELLITTIGEPSSLLPELGD